MSEESRTGDDSTEEEQPECECVQSWECDVWCTNLQWHQHVCKASKQWSCKEQKHDCSVHGEQLVVLFVALDNLDAWSEEFCTDHKCHEATDAEEDE